ncbi:MAG: pilin glycosylation ligase domain-containing protein, partial [Acetobacteraceae bacterium]
MGAALRGDWLVAAAAAVAAPTLIAFNLPPSATFLNQTAAMVGWGAWALMLAVALPRGAASALGSAGTSALLAALLLVAASAFASPLWARLPWSLALPALGMLAAAMLVAALASALQRSGHAEDAFAAFCVALLIAGVAGTLIGFVQVYAPQWADGTWIAVSANGDRAVGNLRQPNHLSSLLLWAMIATVWLGEGGRLPRRLVPAV